MEMWRVILVLAFSSALLHATSARKVPGDDGHGSTTDQHTMVVHASAPVAELPTGPRDKKCIFGGVGGFAGMGGFAGAGGVMPVLSGIGGGIGKVGGIGVGGIGGGAGGLSGVGGLGGPDGSGGLGGAGGGVGGGVGDLLPHP
ncbi:hypothetical protein C1H46_019945 [Malus baccata]|uniref:Glycine-rich protein n=1 Tax=Malus baccata TaxID=106549 RepID=A0A540M6X9_MALBA|nr:hypothetical protein C1H46_019945 [Malus baccata]